jgi:hypothetical protein
MRVWVCAIVMAGVLAPTLAHAEGPFEAAPIAPRPTDRVSRVRAKGLLIGGIAMFSAAYTPLAIWSALGVNDNQFGGGIQHAGLGQIPIAGAFALGGKDLGTHTSAYYSLSGSLFIVDGVAQVAGLAMAIAGGVLNRQASADAKSPRIVLSPAASGGQVGMVLAGKF